MKLINLMFLLSITGVHASSYLVPVPEELTKYDFWNVTDATAKIENQQLTIRYCLPTELAGDKAPVFQAVGKVTGSFIAVQGDGVEGVCVQSAEKPLACTLKYPFLVIDELSRDKALLQKFIGKELGDRQKIVKLFKADPVGLLIVPVSRVSEE